MLNEPNSPPEFQDARVRGSVRPWQVASDYVIEGGCLVAAADQDGVRTYFPFASPELLGDFTKLAMGADFEILEFARKWGSLGYSGVPVKTGPEEKVAGDPTDWIREHAMQVKKISNLIRYRRSGLDGPLRHSISEFLVEPKDDDFFVFEFTRITGGNRRVLQTFTSIGREFHLVSPDQIPSFVTAGVSPPAVSLLNIDIATAGREFRSDVDKYRLLANIIIQEVINRNIDFMPMKLVMPVFGDLVRSYVFDCLLTAIYSFLADAAVGHLEYVECAYCGSNFQLKHKRQRYCPPLFGNSASLCSIRQRKLNQRNKNKGMIA